jgi:predicted RNA binding protein YcfA (HicA-like mRNA interferase family)
MSRIPQVSGRECVKVLEKIGFYVRRQKGSHIIVIRDDPFNQIVVPDHHEVAPGTLRNILRQVGLSAEQFTELLKQ